MKLILTIIFISLIYSLQGQDCRDSFRQYFSLIDTTSRKVVLFADKMPDLFDGNTLSLKVSNEIKSNELSCCPIYVWYAFVVEIDGTLSNIKICPQFMSCDSISIIEKDTKNLTDQFNKLFREIKTTPGKINNRPIAVAFISKIHYECFDW
jgi:hypothetical protein